MIRFILLATIYSLLIFNTNMAFAQVEVQAWGNITGIRVEGELHQFETSVRLVFGDKWKYEWPTAQERHQTSFNRKGNLRTIKANMDSLFLDFAISDSQKGKAHVELNFDPKKAKDVLAAFYAIHVPKKDFAINGIKGVDQKELPPKSSPKKSKNKISRFSATGVNIDGSDRQINCTFDEEKLVIVKSDKDSDQIGIYILIQEGSLQVGNSSRHVFDIEANGKVDQSPVSIELSPNTTGKEYVGFGGNFQNTKSKT